MNNLNKSEEQYWLCWNKTIRFIAPQVFGSENMKNFFHVRRFWLKFCGKISHTCDIIS